MTRRLRDSLVLFACALALSGNAHANAWDRCRGLFSVLASDAPSSTAFSARISPETSAGIAAELKDILARHPAATPDVPMAGAQFNALYDELSLFAQKHGIAIRHAHEITGVYPDGLNGLKLAGFHRFSDPEAQVPFAARHELAHLFHTLQMRATLRQALRESTPPNAPFPATSINEATVYLKELESGSNYLELEKAVTTTSGLASLGKRANSAKLYEERVAKIIDGTEKALSAGRVRLEGGHTLEDAYGWFISKAPIVLGKSGKELLITRMPFLVFGAAYAYDGNVSDYGIDPRAFGIPKDDMKFREFVEALAGHQTLKPLE